MVSWLIYMITRPKSRDRILNVIKNSGRDLTSAEISMFADVWSGKLYPELQRLEMEGVIVGEFRPVKKFDNTAALRRRFYKIKPASFSTGGLSR